MKNEVFLDKNYRDYKQVHRQQQRIAESYWKEKQNEENETGRENYLKIRKALSMRFSLAMKRTYVCRECQSRGTVSDSIEMTYF